MSDNVTVIGLQWGDEGKGKVVDALAKTCRYVVRYCGGANAGHTVNVNGEKFAFHLIPCGILHPEVCNIVGNGVAFDPGCAWQEITALRQRGVRVCEQNLRISAAAQVVMPYHKLEDTLREQSLASGRKIGTTARGIGPCYADKAHRSTAIRANELTAGDALTEKIHRIVEHKNAVFSALYDAEALDADAIAAEYSQYGRDLGPMICNTGALLRGAAPGERILFEGGQGSMLDIDHGTYPFVTSSSVTACGVSPGAGVPPSDVGQVIGVIKAYCSRVGAGPFPTEQDNATGEYLRERGREYGTTTGRPRRCGWFDAAAARYAADLSGVGELALSLLDVLSGLDEVKICTGYGAAAGPFDPTAMADVECTYESLSPWQGDLSSAKSFDDLPGEAQVYVNRIEELMARPVGIIGVGPDREQTIMHHTSVTGLS